MGWSIPVSQQKVHSFRLLEHQIFISTAVQRFLLGHCQGPWVSLVCIFVDVIFCTFVEPTNCPFPGFENCSGTVHGNLQEIKVSCIFLRDSIVAGYTVIMQYSGTNHADKCFISSTRDLNSSVVVEVINSGSCHMFGFPLLNGNNLVGSRVMFQQDVVVVYTCDVIKTDLLTSLWWVDFSFHCCVVVGTETSSKLPTIMPTLSSTTTHESSISLASIVAGMVGLLLLHGCSLCFILVLFF